MPEIPLLHAILGGVMMGAGLGLLMLFNGQIGGVGGSYSALLRGDLGEHKWKLLFVLSVVLGGGLAAAMFPGHFDGSRLDRSLPIIVASGVAMGFGGRLCNGCTSGHGLCGIARFSRRSIVATGTFFGIALLASYLFRVAGGGS